jgi:hypothetical protein
MIYSCVEITRTRRVLHRAEAGVQDWEHNRDIPESSITFIRPRITLSILQTSRLIQREAAPILQTKIEAMKSIPVEFYVDEAAMQAMHLFRNSLHMCCYEEGFSRHYNYEQYKRTSEVARKFIEDCDCNTQVQA